MSRSVFFKSAINLLTTRDCVECCAGLDFLDFGEKETRLFLALSDIPSVSSNTRFGDSCSFFVIDPLSKILILHAHIQFCSGTLVVLFQDPVFFNSTESVSSPSFSSHSHSVISSFNSVIVFSFVSFS